MHTVYRLREDRQHIAAVQWVTLNGGGLEQTHGLLGSEEWWKRIEAGELPLHTIHGTLSYVYMSGHNDFPECEVTSGSGERTQWPRYGEDSWYQVGNSIEIDYVVQRYKQPVGLPPDSRVVVEVRIARKA